MNKKTISKYAQFCAMKTMNELKASPMLYLSGGSGVDQGTLIYGIKKIISNE